MSLTADQVARIFEQRFDYQAARVVMKQAAERAGLDPKGPFDANGLAKMADHIAGIADRVDGLVASLRDAGGPAPSGKAAPAKGKAPAKAPAKADPPAETAEAEPAEAESAEAEAAPAEEKKPASRRGRGRKKPAAGS